MNIFKRAAAILLVLLAVVAVARSDTLHHALVDVLSVAEAWMREYPRSGVFLFLLLAALSSMLTFFSSVALVPVGVYVWGPTTTLLLLLLGGSTGGIGGYWAARTWGRRIVRRLFPDAPLRRYEMFFRTRARWSSVMLFRFALQSELPSYVMGLVKYPFRKYVPIILLGELPYVIVVVYLGDAFLERNSALFAAVFIAAVGLSVWSWRRLQNEMRAAQTT
jgi:uncharacterized membrane protein YdjX (TVP38/TMEM64 family)